MDAGLTRPWAAPLAQLLDLLDYGLLLLAPDGRVLHMNKSARRELDADHPLQRGGRQAAVARARAGHGVARGHPGQAALRGLRKLLALPHGAGQTSVAVVPLAPPAGGLEHGVALLLARRAVCEPLTVEWFARSHGLTMAETAVVKGLCADLTPHEIAQPAGRGPGHGAHPDRQHAPEDGRLQHPGADAPGVAAAASGERAARAALGLRRHAAAAAQGAGRNGFAFLSPVPRCPDRSAGPARQSATAS